MGLLDNVKSFLHSVVTDDHYALYGSPYSNSTAGGSVNADTSSTTRLHELNNSLTHSLMSSRNGSATNIAGYRPGLRSSATNLNSSQELQTFGANGRPPLPSVESLWQRVEQFWAEEYPELEENLNSGASTADLNELEKDLAVGPFPVEVRQFYKIHDGQFRGGKPTGVLMGLTLLDIESMMEEYALWAKVAERVEKQQLSLEHQEQLLSVSDASSSASQAIRERIQNNYLMHQKSVPVDAVQSYYVHRGWIPIAKDLYGNLLGLDLAPGPAGVRGQIILYGRDFDTKVVVATSLQELLFQYVTDLETGNYQIDKSETNEDNGFLDTDRDDDYLIGDEDEDNGELQFFDRKGSEFGKALQGKITYIEALKWRALKRYGITNAESFQTSFTPQRIPKKKASPRQSETSSPDVTQTSSSKAGNLVSVDSAADLLKETLIDGDKTKTPAKETTSTETEKKANKGADKGATESAAAETTKPESETKDEVKEDAEPESLKEETTLEPVDKEVGEEKEKDEEEEEKVESDVKESNDETTSEIPL